jgi:hypothetical protein
MNRAQPNHNASRFGALKHFVFTFRDSWFEHVANDAALVLQISKWGWGRQKTSKSDGKPFERNRPHPEIPKKLNNSTLGCPSVYQCIARAVGYGCPFLTWTTPLWSGIDNSVSNP